MCDYVWEHQIKKVSKVNLLDEYVRNEVKYRQMSLSEDVSIPTIQKRLDAIQFDNFFLKTLRKGM
jgi:hypothetical protein